MAHNRLVEFPQAHNANAHIVPLITTDDPAEPNDNPKSTDDNVSPTEEEPPSEPPITSSLPPFGSPTFPASPEAASAPTTPLIRYWYWTNENEEERNDPTDVLRTLPSLLSSPSRSSLHTLRAVRRVRQAPDVEDTPDPIPRLSSSRSVDNLASKDGKKVFKSIRRRLTSLFTQKGKTKAKPAETSDQDDGDAEPKSPSTSRGIEHIAPPVAVRRVRSFATPEEIRTPKVSRRLLDTFDEATREASFTAKDLSGKFQYAPVEEEE